ncbi:hypothetical protein CYMTET_20640 [Cymbomonas tetramitiformis]|uniref:EF-hand domain-containing protein n=1 Tax=Cymbomonas tetramitiformis TaxID=36881 RepID=A0AAE0G3X5_9CHLO|nr:hypothetical protein CYMTET_20640 [Cymbomonas tetramitiformis]
MDTDADGTVSKEELSRGLKQMELCASAGGKRKRLTDKAIETVVNAVHTGRPIDEEHFREAFVFLPNNELATCSSYFMKVGIDTSAPFRSQPPDKRKDGHAGAHLIAGGLSGCIAKTATAPLNNIAVQGALHSDATLWGTVQRMYAKQGSQAFFRGNLANAGLSIPWKGLDFFTFSFYKQHLLTPDQLEPSDLQRLLAGGLSGATSELLLYPMDLVTGRMFLTNRLYSDPISGMYHIARTEGFLALYKGIDVSLPGSVLYTGVSFGSYDILKRIIKGYNAQAELDSKTSSGTDTSPAPTKLQTFFAGTFAGWCGMTASYPLNVIRRRLQVQGLINTQGSGFQRLPWGIEYRSSLEAIYRIGVEEGFAAFFGGWKAMSLKMAPSSGISFLAYEVIRERLTDESKQY